MMNEIMVGMLNKIVSVHCPEKGCTTHSLLIGREALILTLTILLALQGCTQYIPPLGSVRIQYMPTRGIQAVYGIFLIIIPSLEIYQEIKTL